MKKYELRNISFENTVYRLNDNDGFYYHGNLKLGLFDLLMLNNVRITEVFLKLKKVLLRINDKIQYENEVYTILSFYFHENILCCQIKDSKNSFKNAKCEDLKSVSQESLNEMKNKKIKQIEEVAAKFLNNRTIRLTRTLKKRNETPKNFLISFFTKWNVKGNETEKETIFSDDSSIQCQCGRRRSLGDLYYILKYYYPDITVKDVIKLLFEELPNDIPLRTSYCGLTNRRMFYHDGREKLIYDKNTKDENGMTYDEYINLIK